MRKFPAYLSWYLLLSPTLVASLVLAAKILKDKEYSKLQTLQYLAQGSYKFGWPNPTSFRNFFLVKIPMTFTHNTTDSSQLLKLVIDCLLEFFITQLAFHKTVLNQSLLNFILLPQFWPLFATFHTFSSYHGSPTSEFHTFSSFPYHVRILLANTVPQQSGNVFTLHLWRIFLIHRIQQIYVKYAGKCPTECLYFIFNIEIQHAGMINFSE